MSDLCKSISNTISFSRNILNTTCPWHSNNKSFAINEVFLIRLNKQFLHQSFPSKIQAIHESFQFCNSCIHKIIIIQNIRNAELKSNCIIESLTTQNLGHLFENNSSYFDTLYLNEFSPKTITTQMNLNYMFSNVIVQIITLLQSNSHNSREAESHLFILTLEKRIISKQYIRIRPTHHLSIDFRLDVSNSNIVSEGMLFTVSRHNGHMCSTSPNETIHVLRLKL